MAKGARQLSLLYLFGTLSLAAVGIPHHGPEAREASVFTCRRGLPLLFELLADPMFFHVGVAVSLESIRRKHIKTPWAKLLPPGSTVTLKRRMR